MRFVCEKCGEIEPTKIGYSFPRTATCPKCNAYCTDLDWGGFKIMSEEEARKFRPGMYKDDEKDK